MKITVFTREPQELEIYDIGEGSPVFFLPGGGCNTSSYQTFLQILSKTHRVIAINYPGFDKTMQPKAALEIDYYARCIAAAIETYGFSDNKVIAHSMGGGVTLDICHLFPKLISKTVLLAPMLRQYPGSLQKLATKVALSATKSTLREAVLKGELVSFLQSKAKNGTESLRQLEMLTKRFKVPFTDDCSTEKLMIIGVNDVIFPLEEQMQLAERICNITIMPLENTGHDLIFDMPDEIVHTITGFFTDEV